MRNTNEILHDYIKSIAQKDWLALDLTCGRGYDTLLLAQCCHKVISLDIQEEAITSAKILNKNYTNIDFHLMDHSDLSALHLGPIDIAIFNLGYLPKGDKTITTTKESTLLALDQVYKLLKKGRSLLVTIYPGHPQGKIEAPAVLNWIDQKQFSSQDRYSYNKEDAPIAIIATK